MWICFYSWTLLSLLQTLPTTVIHYKKSKIYAEMAITPKSQTIGLMYRRHLKPAHGMLFVFPYKGIYRFWMKNTFVPLDLIFLNKEKQVLGIIENTTPKSLKPLYIETPYQYVLEIKAGQSKRMHIVKGSTLKWNDHPKKTPSSLVKRSKH